MVPDLPDITPEDLKYDRLRSRSYLVYLNELPRVFLGEVWQDTRQNWRHTLSGDLLTWRTREAAALHLAFVTQRRGARTFDGERTFETVKNFLDLLETLFPPSERTAGEWHCLLRQMMADVSDRAMRHRAALLKVALEELPTYQLRDYERRSPGREPTPLVDDSLRAGPPA